MIKQVLSAFLAVAVLATTACSKAPDEYINEAQQLTTPPPVPKQQDYEKAISILSEGIEAHPDEQKLYLVRSQAFIAMKDYGKAKQDLNEVHSLGNNNLSAESLRCMLGEKISGFNPQVKQCYQQAESLAEKAGSTGNAPSVDQVVLALLAKDDDAQALANGYIEHAPETPSTQFYKSMFKEFDRSEYIQSSLP